MANDKFWSSLLTRELLIRLFFICNWLLNFLLMSNENNWLQSIENVLIKCNTKYNFEICKKLSGVIFVKVCTIKIRVRHLTYLAYEHHRGACFWIWTSQQVCFKVKTTDLMTNYLPNQNKNIRREHWVTRSSGVLLITNTIKRILVYVWGGSV